MGQFNAGGAGIDPSEIQRDAAIIGRIGGLPAKYQLTRTFERQVGTGMGYLVIADMHNDGKAPPAEGHYRHRAAAY